jgi:hypothetical protein
MTRKKSDKKSLIQSPFEIEINYGKMKTEERKILEFDPNRIKANEVVVVNVSKWGGLLNQSFAVLNCNGKEIVIRQLKKEKNV